MKLAGLSSETQIENSLTINEPHVLHHSTRDLKSLPDVRSPPLPLSLIDFLAGFGRISKLFLGESGGRVPPVLVVATPLVFHLNTNSIVLVEKLNLCTTENKPSMVMLVLTVKVNGQGQIYSFSFNLSSKFHLRYNDSLL